MVRKPGQNKQTETPAREDEACRNSSDSETEVDLASGGRGEDARYHQRAEKAMVVVEELRGKMRTSGRNFTREEMNER